MKIIVKKAEQSNNKSVIPTFYSKVDSTLLKGGKPFFLPEFTLDCRAEFHIALHICRLGKGIAPQFASRYYDALTLAVTFTAHDIPCDNFCQHQMATNFDGSTMLGEFVSMDQLKLSPLTCNIFYNTPLNSIIIPDFETVANQTISQLSHYFTWRQGDLLLLESIGQTQAVRENDLFKGSINNAEILQFFVK